MEGLNAEIIGMWQSDMDNKHMDALEKLQGRLSGIAYPSGLFWFENGEMVDRKLEIETGTEAFLILGFDDRRTTLDQGRPFFFNQDDKKEYSCHLT